MCGTVEMSIFGARGRVSDISTAIAATRPDAQACLQVVLLICMYSDPSSCKGNESIM